jgi:hypothetical protein
MKLLGWILAGVMLAFLVGTADYHIAVGQENEKLKSVFRSLGDREPGCSPAEDQRIICARKNGAVSILILGPKDEVVAGPLKAQPIKRKPLGRGRKET